jgi:hypothetical protein
MSTVARSDGHQEAIRRRARPVPECFGCGAPGWVVERDKNVRRLTLVRVIADGTALGATLGRTLLCGECIGKLEPLDPDPLTVEGAA